jgi:hypothetical protein
MTLSRTSSSHRIRHAVALVLLFIVIVASIVLFVSIVSALRRNPSTAATKPPQDTEIEEPPSGSSFPIRREWRSLTQTEQQHYISSVHCLTSIPSKLHKDSSLYEDFPWVHSHVGYYTHHSTPFLP